MRTKPQKRLRIIACAVVALLLAAGALFLVVVQPGGSGQLASLQLPDGSEYVVAQRCNWSTEPYTVSFYMRSPEGEWGWCYIDHQATRWSDVKLTYDSDKDEVVVTERGKRRAVLDRKRSMFWLDNGSFQRELEAPQSEGAPAFAGR